MEDAKSRLSASDALEQVHALLTMATNLNTHFHSQGETIVPGAVVPTLSDLVQQASVAEGSVAALVGERDDYRALADTAALVNSTLDLTQVLNEVMDTIVKLTGSERGYLVLRDEDTGEFTLRVARNMERESLDGEAFQVSRTIVRQVAETGEPVMTTDALADPRFSAQESVVNLNLRSILCVPLKLRGRVTGVIYTENRIRQGLFQEAQRELLTAFADQAAVAIQNAQLFESVSEMKRLQDNIFASITSGVITADVGNAVTLLNRAAEEILGLVGTQSVGAILSSVLPPLDARFDNIVAQVRKEERQVRAVEFEPEVANRGAITLSMNISPLKDAEDATQGIAIVLDDLTEQKRRETQIAGVRRYLPSEVVDGLASMDALRLGGTRQICSILFADIRGFSTFSENVPPEKLVEIVNTYFTLAGDAIHGQQGVVDKFMGDAVMALFNPSIRPQSDHALRAVRAAAAVLAEVEAYHQSISPQDRLHFGIGIHTGEAVTGNIGSPDRLDYSALGDSVNLAKRLQEVAEAGQILISEDTYHAVEIYVEVERLEPIQVKGRSQYTQIYQLLSVSS